jgi:hypothetical protein
MLNWARSRWELAPVVAAFLWFLGLATVRIAGAWSTVLMVLSMVSMAVIVLVAPRRAWSGDRPATRVGAALGVVLGAYAVTVAASFAVFGSGTDNWLTAIPRLFEQLVPGSVALRVLAMVVCLGLLVPLLEEVCFRGAFFTAARQRIGPTGAVLATSALWAVVHLGDYGLNPYNLEVVAGSQLSVFVMGLGLGVCRLLTGSVAVCVVAQGTANLALYGCLLIALG